mgnify:FL=1
MKVVVAYSGGKDSQASLIWAVNQYGKENVLAVFCDTGWEHSVTYQHIKSTTALLGVKLIVLKSKKYDGLLDLAIKKKRFPSTKARFCTSELKAIPMIDWVLSQQEHLLIIQGIRAAESKSRSLMQEHCRFFKYYFTPIKTDKNGKDIFHTYRKKEVIEWCKQFDDSLLRPVFHWSAQQVIDYILANKQTPNPLYSKGAHRVGCFPCVMSNKTELKSMCQLTPEWIEKVNQAEILVGSSFFPPNYIPKQYCSLVDKNGKSYPSVADVVNYLTEFSGNLFENDEVYNRSCMSFYSGLCE